MINWEGYERKQLQKILRKNMSICLMELRKTIKTLVRVASSCDLKLGPPKYESGCKLLHTSNSFSKVAKMIRFLTKI
jgi:hypothetical protein